MSYPPLIDLRIVFWCVVHFISPCSLFPIDNLSIYAQNFFKFCIHIVIGVEWYGIVSGQNPTIFDGVTALSPFKKWFLACLSFTVYDIWMKLHRYVEQQRLHITTKDRHSYLSSSWVIRPWLIWKMFLTCSSFTIWNIWMKLHRYVDHQRLHIVTKDRHSYLSSSWVIRPWLIWKNGFWRVVHLLYGISEWNFTDMLTIKGYRLWLRIVTLTFPDCELSTLDWSENCFLTCSSFTIWNIWMKLHRYVEH